MADSTGDAVRDFLVAKLGWNPETKKQAIEDTIKNKKRAQALLEFSKEVCIVEKCSEYFFLSQCGPCPEPALICFSRFLRPGQLNLNRS